MELQQQCFNAYMKVLLVRVQQMGWRKKDMTARFSLCQMCYAPASIIQMFPNVLQLSFKLKLGTRQSRKSLYGTGG